MDIYTLSVAATNLKMSPVFEIIHYSLMSINIKKDFINLTSFHYERKHPLASWLATMLICFAGGIFNCFLFGKPLATLLVNPEKIALATVLWYIINYVPGVFALLTTRALLTVILCLKEIHRVYGVYNGVLEATTLYPGHYLVIFTNGYIKGASGEILMFFARLMAGYVKPNSYQFLAPSVFLFPSSVFKTSAALSLIFCLEKFSVIKVDHSILFACCLLLCIYFRTCMTWGIMGDPFIPFENLFCSIVFGGMWDAYKRVAYTEHRNNNAANNGDTHHSKQKKS